MFTEITSISTKLATNRKNRSAVLRAPISFPTIEVEYFGVKQAIMCSETSLQNHPDLDQSKTQ